MNNNLNILVTHVLKHKLKPLEKNRFYAHLGHMYYNPICTSLIKIYIKKHIYYKFEHCVKHGPGILLLWVHVE